MTRRGLKPNLARRPRNEIDAVAAQIDPYFLCYPARASARRARYAESRTKARKIIAALDAFRTAGAR